MIRAIRSISVVLAALLVSAMLAAPASAASRTLTVTKAGTGNGTVTSSPPGINCGATCSTTFNQGTVVTLTATPDAASTFGGWSGACTGTGSCSVTMPNGNTTTSVTATFVAIPRQLTVSKSGTGTGTVTSSPPGIDCGATCSASFPQGSSVTLTATPDANSTFGGWSGGGCSGTGTCMVTMNANRSVTATFTIKSYTLSVSKAGTGNGTVTSSPAGINCGATCSASFNHGTVVTLTATPDANSTFGGWSGGGCSGTGTCVVTLTAATSVTATFDAITHQLTVIKTGTGTGTVTSSPAGINCGSTCSANFNQGSSVDLTATPDAGSTFTGWSGSGCTGTGTCTVSITTAKSVTATFTINSYALSVSKAGTGNGTVTSSPAGINCGATCSASFNHGTVLTLSATPDSNSTFGGWSGGGCSGTGTCVVTMTAATSVTATFTIKSYTLSVSKAGTGNGTVTSSPAGINCGATCSASFNHGTVVTLTATPDANSTFGGWSGGGCSGTGTCVVTLTAATSVTATFDAITHQLTVIKTGTGTGTVTSSPAGINCGSTCSANFNQGTTVTLTAASDPFSTFTGWSGSGCTGTNDCVVTIDTAKSVDAGFELNRYPLTVTLAGSGGGVVAADVGSIDCGATCTDDYDALTDLVLTATPDASSVFVGWSGDCSGTGTCNLTMDGAKAARATFILKTFDVTVSRAGAGLGTVTSNPVGIDCGITCTATYDALDVVTLTATSEINSSFSGWSGDCTGTGDCVLDIDSAKSVTATFDPILHDVVVATTGAGGGLVTSSPVGIDCGSSCTATFNQGTTVTLAAAADPDSLFTGWSGDCTGTGDCVLDVDGPHSVSANFSGPRQPDGLVGIPGKPLKGAGIFNLTGTGQSQTGKVKPGKSKTYVVVVSNLGLQADSFTIAGEGAKSPFKVSYLVEGLNITADVVAGNYRSPSLWSQESLTIELKVKAKKHAKKGNLQSWLTTVTSVADPSRADAVMVSAKVKKK